MHAAAAVTAGTQAFALWRVACLLLLGATGTVCAASDDDHADEVPVTVSLDGRPFASDFVVIERDGVLYLPLLNTASLLSFVVEASDAAHASGHRGDPERGYAIHAGNSDAVIDGMPARIEAQDALVASDMLWVSAALAARLLPIEAVLDTRQFVLQITATGELPAAAQQRRSKDHAALQAGAERVPLEVRAGRFPYRAWSLPAGDIQMLASVRDAEGEFGLRALLAGDLLWMNSALFVSASQAGLDEVRLRLSRESAGGGAFGWNALTRAEIGDVFGSSLPLLGSSAGGRGVVLSSFPLDQQTEFDSTRIEGDALPGWQVEVYGNDRLLDFRQVGSDGRYLFERLPVLFGENQYRLVFFGPGGQRREEVRSVRVGADRIPAGEWRARVAAHQPGQSLFGVGEVPSPALANAASAELRYGVRKWLTVGGFLARAPISAELDAPSSDYAGFVARASLGAVALNLDLVAQDNDAAGGSVGAISEIAGTSVSARWSEYHGLQTAESARGSEFLERELFVRLNRPLPESLLHNADVALELTHGVFAAGREEDRMAAIVRQQLGGIGLEHELQYQRIRSGEIAQGQWQLRSSGTFSLAQVHLRAQLAADAGGVNGLNLSGLWSFRPNTYFGFNYSHQFEALEDDLSAYVAHDFGWLNMRLVGGHSDPLGVYGNLELSFSFAFDQQHRPIFSSRRLASGGLIEPFIYLDRDNDGRFDAGRDHPLSGVTMALDQSTRANRSDAHGRLQIDSLATASRSVLAIDARSLTDPFHHPATAAVSFQARPGTWFRPEFAVLETGTIQGHVYRRTDGQRLHLAGVRLELQGDGGKVVATSVSQVDGYYVFEGVLRGFWQVLPAAGNGNALSPVAAASRRSAHVTAEQLMIDGLDIEL